MIFRDYITEASKEAMLTNLTKNLDRLKLKYTIKEKVNHNVVIIGKYTVSVAGVFHDKYTLFQQVGGKPDELKSYKYDETLQLVGYIKNGGY